MKRWKANEAVWQCKGFISEICQKRKEAIAEQLLEDMHARTVIKTRMGICIRFMPTVPVFGECKAGTTRVNLALTMYYNSRTQQTEICAAVPAIG